ncbi:carbon-nitrogen hydrolase family protein, partial [Bifidobacterium longum]
MYLKAQDGHNCDASLWINEQGHISAEPLEMFL